MPDSPNPDERRFRTAAAHYLDGRPAYAARLIHRVVELTGLDRTHRVMDLGCGPGQLAIAFAPFAAEVLAIDPEPAMLEIATAQGARAGVSVRFMRSHSGELGPALGHFRLVTIGRAFHWMDRKATLECLDTLIEPGGAIAFFGDRHPGVQANAWDEPYTELLRRYGAEDKTHPVHRAPKLFRHEEILLDSPFATLERIAVIERRRTPVATFVERAFSQSSTAPDRLGEKAEQLAREVEALMKGSAQDGLVTEIVETHALLARRD
jgi:2-polyprenyl-3-methyl-5-hydroxy-6-metoxy-1,4-benzoquinol methylase